MNRKMSLTVTGLTASAIERAERSSFYGIHGDSRDCHMARTLCSSEVIKRLNEDEIPWESFQVLWAKSLPTEGTKTPYKAVILYTVAA